MSNPALGPRGLTRRTLLGVSAAATAGLAVGCGSSGGGASSISADDPIQIMLPLLGAQAPPAGNPIDKKLEEISGRKITLMWVPSQSYNDKVNVTLASSDLPHLIAIQGKPPLFVKTALAGGFWDLTDKLKDYPNLVTPEESILMNSSINGRVFGILRRRMEMWTSTTIRKDWLDKLGIAMPKTTDEFALAMKEFQGKDPDGNGKADTTGLISPQWPTGFGTNSPFDIVATWFGAGNRWLERDGNLVPSFQTEEFVKANLYLRDLAATGAMNKDFPSMPVEKFNDAVFNGVGGAAIDVEARTNQIRALFSKKYPDTWANYIDFTGNLIGPDGTMHAHPTDGYAGIFAIPKGGKVKTDADLDVILTFLNQLNSLEGVVAVGNGVEGVTYIKQGEEIAQIQKPTAEQQELIAVKNSYGQLTMNPAGHVLPKNYLADEVARAAVDRMAQVHEADIKFKVVNPGAPFVSDTYQSKGVQLDNIVADARTKFIAGQIDEAAFRAELERWGSTGGNDVIKETNELFHASK